MLGKLMKYEIKGTARLLLPVYVALLAMTLINKIFLSINSEATGFIMTTGISMTLYVCIIMALIVMTFIVIIQRFYKNLMTDEGYLMFTLPVPTWQQIVSKLIIALMWSLVCGIVIMLSIMILAIDGTSLQYMGQFFQELGQAFNSPEGGQAILILFELFILMIVGICANVLQVYASISIGQLFGKHKVLGAFGAYIVINIILQTIFTVMTVSFALTADTSMINAFFNNMDPVAAVNWMMNLATLGNLVLAAIYFAATNYILKHKLNLE
ncbi:hypothetical protein [Eubacterium sp. 1001713B170207_170306_E7]|uniref:hypothetical protein n=1 Tax=Eubacterium sp. 1001713B170207_170306_E7 TaxID=2787097 RepID=UPI0018985A93|nr:hypothetical protein [Eubacterium sp. 1001713B170207_170306_E7]